MTTTQISNNEFQTEANSHVYDSTNVQISKKEALKQRVGGVASVTLVNSSDTSSHSSLSDIPTIVFNKITEYFTSYPQETVEPTVAPQKPIVVKPKTAFTPSQALKKNTSQETLHIEPHHEINQKSFRDFTTSIYNTVTDYFAEHTKQANKVHLSATPKPAPAPQKFSALKLKQIATPTSAQIEAEKKRLEPKPERQPDVLNPKTFSEITTNIYNALSGHFADFAQYANAAHPTPTVKLVSTSKQPAELAKAALKPVPAKPTEELILNPYQSDLHSNSFSEITTSVYHAIAKHFGIKIDPPKTTEAPKPAAAVTKPAEPVNKLAEPVNKPIAPVNKPAEPIKATTTTPSTWRTKDIQRIALWGIALAATATAVYYGYQYYTSIGEAVPKVELPTIPEENQSKTLYERVTAWFYSPPTTKTETSSAPQTTTEASQNESGGFPSSNDTPSKAPETTQQPPADKETDEGGFFDFLKPKPATQSKAPIYAPAPTKSSLDQLKDAVNDPTPKSTSEPQPTSAPVEQTPNATETQDSILTRIVETVTRTVKLFTHTPEDPPTPQTTATTDTPEPVADSIFTTTNILTATATVAAVATAVAVVRIGILPCIARIKKANPDLDLKELTNPEPIHPSSAKANGASPATAKPNGGNAEPTRASSSASNAPISDGVPTPKTSTTTTPASPGATNAGSSPTPPPATPLDDDNDNDVDDKLSNNANLLESAAADADFETPPDSDEENVATTDEVGRAASASLANDIDNDEDVDDESSRRPTDKGKLHPTSNESTAGTTTTTTTSATSTNMKQNDDKPKPPSTSTSASASATLLKDNKPSGRASRSSTPILSRRTQLGSISSTSNEADSVDEKDGNHTSDTRDADDDNKFTTPTKARSVDEERTSGLTTSKPKSKQHRPRVDSTPSPIRPPAITSTASDDDDGDGIPSDNLSTNAPPLTPSKMTGKSLDDSGIMKSSPPPPPPPPGSGQQKTEAQKLADWNKQEDARLETEWKERAKSFDKIATVKSEKNRQEIDSKNSELEGKKRYLGFGQADPVKYKDLIALVEGEIEGLENTIQTLLNEKTECMLDQKNPSHLKLFTLQELKILYMISGKSEYTDVELNTPNPNKLPFFMEQQKNWSRALNTAAWIPSAIMKTIEEYQADPNLEPKEVRLAYGKRSLNSNQTTPALASKKDPKKTLDLDALQQLAAERAKNSGPWQSPSLIKRTTSNPPSPDARTAQERKGSRSERKSSRVLVMKLEEKTKILNEYHTSFFGELLPKLVGELKAKQKLCTANADRILTLEEMKSRNNEEETELGKLIATRDEAIQRCKELKDTVIPQVRELTARAEITEAELPAEYVEAAKKYASDKLTKHAEKQGIILPPDSMNSPASSSSASSSAGSADASIGPGSTPPSPTTTGGAGLSITDGK